MTEVGGQITGSFGSKASGLTPLQTSHAHLWVIFFAILLLVFAFVYNTHISC